MIILIVERHRSKQRKPSLKLIGNTLFKTKDKTNFYPFLGWFNWQKTYDTIKVNHRKAMVCSLPSRVHTFGC